MPEDKTDPLFYAYLLEFGYNFGNNFESKIYGIS